MDIFGVIGFPVKHSLSPAMHNAAFRHLNLDAEYKLFEVAPEKLKNFMIEAGQKGIQGLSVTIPHKVAIIDSLDDIDDKAKSIGAVNTVLNKNGRFIGTNTDCDGFLRAIEEIIPAKNKKALLIGCGGAARAAIYALDQAGAKTDMAVRSDDMEAAKKLAQKYKINAFDLKNLNNFDYDIVVHATPVGMEPNIDQSVINPDFFRKNMVVFDMVYKPKMTKFLKDAKSKGCAVITGDNMLLYQGVKQFELFTGLEAPVEVMRAEINRATLLMSPNCKYFFHKNFRKI